MVVYGLMPVGAKYLMDGFDPLLFAGVASCIGAVPFWGHSYSRGVGHLLWGGRFARPLFYVVILTAIANGLFFVGLHFTTAMNAGLLEQIEPVYAALLSVLFLGERISRLQMIATSCMVLGALSVAYQGYAGFNPGDLMILSAPLLFQIAHLIAKRILPDLPQVFILPAVRLMYGGLLMIAVALCIDPVSFASLLDPQLWVCAGVFGLFFRTLDLGLWYQALRYVPLSVVSALLPIGAGVGFFAAILFLGEVPFPHHYIGIALIALGLILLSRVKQKAAELC